MTITFESCVQNAPQRLEYASALKALETILRGLPPVIIAIDGKVGVGKTTLGRFLAWRFNITLLETDLYFAESTATFEYFEYKVEEAKRVIEARFNRNRPIIVEGVEARKLLAEANLEPKFVIRVTCNQAEGTPTTNKLWQQYARQYPDLKEGYLLLDLPAID